MATARQIVALLSSHNQGDEEQFLSIALQVAADEARRGRREVADELRRLVDAARKNKTSSAPRPSGRRGDVATSSLYVELQEREAKIRRLVDANIVGIFIWELEGGILEANDAFLRIVGYDREDLISGRIRWTDLTPPEWLERHERSWIPELKTTGSVQPFEKEYFRKDGSRVPVLVGAASFDETANQGVTFVLDLTERKRAEDALRESEERFRTLVQFSFDVYWETDAQHRFVRQEFAETLVDPPSGSEIGKTRWEVPYLEPDSEAWRKHRETLDAHLPFRDFELGRPTPDGGRRYVSVSGLPVFDRTGRFIGYRGVGRHITDRKRAEETLREAQTELAHANRVATMGQLTSSIAHEVNQPITATVAYAQAALRFLRSRPLDLEAVRQALGNIVNDGKRAGEVIGRIRALIQKAPQRRDSVNINEAVREVIDVNRRPKLTHYRRPILTPLGAAIEGLDWGIGEGEQAARERALR